MDWYKFDPSIHRWSRDCEGSALRLFMATEGVDELVKETKKINGLIMSDSTNKEHHEQTKKLMCGLAANLKNSSFQNCIFTEMKCLFHQERFLALLDKQAHLMGFVNGVYDFNAKEFRDGYCEDLIMFSTHIR